MTLLSTISLWSSLFLPSILAFAPGSANWAEQGFYFDWNNDSLPLPTPITAQCETIKVKWSRSAGTGPDPASPYIIKLYTSTYLNSFVVDAGDSLQTSLPIPFDPGSQYVMCMTDTSGISGGCQDLYTVYPSGNTTCRNVTVPATTLGVKMTSIMSGGLLSRYGWPASCSDLQFDLIDGFGGGVIGTPPYTLTVAPAFRTPVNITFQTSVQWTVVLDHGHAFFVSITDNQGTSWANGPLHAGEGSLNCFGTPPPYPWLTLGVSLGMSFSFLVLGLLLALIGAWCFATRRPIHFPSPRHTGDKTVEPYITSTFSHDTGVHTSRVGGSGTGGNGSFFNGLHLRRPLNSRAPSSEMVLMNDRPALRRDQTDATLDLTALPTEGNYLPAPFSHNEDSFRRHPSIGGPPADRSNDVTVVPWTHTVHGNVGPPGALDERGTIEASLAHPVSHTPLKHRPDSNSSTLGGSPTTAGAIVDTRGLSIPGAPARSPSNGIGGVQISPPKSSSVTAPFASANYGHSHQNSDPSVPIVRSHSHSSSVPANANDNYTPNTGAPSTSDQSQQTHQHRQQPMHEVYVVHHDAGLAPPVTVFTRPGTLVTELPPGYDNLIPDLRQDAARANETNATNANKQHTSTSGSRSGTRNPNPPSLAIPDNQSDRPRGMGLVNVEDTDTPLSAISSEPPIFLPPGNTENSHTQQEN